MMFDADSNILGIVRYYCNILCTCVVQELWEENLSAAVSLQVLEIIEKFSGAVASRAIATDYGKIVLHLYL